VSYATRGTATGFSSDQFQLSTDGVNVTDFSSAYNPRSSVFLLKRFDLSATPGIADNPNAAFRIVFNGATSDLGNNRIDNLQVIGAQINFVAGPEPPSGALALPAVGLAGLTARSYLRRIPVSR